MYALAGKFCFEPGLVVWKKNLNGMAGAILYFKQSYSKFTIDFG